MLGIFFNTAGTIGVAIILTTYFFLQTHRIEAHELRYSMLNLTGASLILLSLYWDFNLPSFIVEIAWVMISLFGIVRHFRKRGQVAN